VGAISVSSAGPSDRMFSGLQLIEQAALVNISTAVFK
jgi:hypothetical protein